MSKPFVQSILGLMACAAVATPVCAADSFFATANVQDFDNTCGELTGGGGGRSSAPISAGFACPGASSAAFATPGHVGTTNFVSGNGSAGGGGEFDTFVTFLPTNGQDGDRIPVQLNLDFGGSIAVAGSSGANYSVVVDVGGAEFVRSTRILAGTDPTHGDLTLGFSSGGEVDNDNSVFVGGVLTTPMIMAPVGVPISVILQLGAGVFGNPGTANTLFEHSLDFAQGQPLFILPDGYTAEDPSAFVFDNRFTPPGGVPEPASWALMIAGFGLAGATLRLRRKRALA